MKTDCCQNAMGGCDHPSQPPSPWRRAGGAAGWMVPGITLVLIPNCPLCLAAYVAMATGIGLSLPVAAVLRLALLIVCVSALTLVVGAKARRFWLRTGRSRGKIGTTRPA